MDEFDVVIAGGGIAGLTAGMLSARLGRSTLVVTGLAPGGHLVSIDRIDGVPGFPEGVPGYELCPIAEEQAQAAGADFRATEVEQLEQLEQGWRVQTSEGDVRARAVILATGSRLKQLGVPGEERLTGRGVSHCASCDAPLMRDQVVGVVGGGDSALQETLTLVGPVSEVIVFQRAGALTGQAAYRSEVLDNPKVSIRYGTVVEEILGEDKVSGVRARNVETGDVEDVALGGIFPFIGLQPNTEVVGELLSLDEGGHVRTDGWMRTELPGLFAAGTLRSESQCQAASSSGDGATAAKAADRYLDDGSWPGQPVAAAEIAA
ncbi:MAG: thioredoxin reductase [Thermoleophilaceae bacterium]|nr:thioredoxin reductase [Thermoleophilaceae bacterium]